ncbi:MAG: menaquinone biosynthesis decarboxylase [Nitrospinae bacterium CG11_big_fil_rev_8_21_14_0_20_56_8]|nr:MAG: menaquinone biosynthesis decarboxylase [Nitrospinae bacterium CG11_big_fil_rev_8_21_14_0_20_56_8]
MNYESLREFIDRLEFEGELLRVREPVSPILEIAEITDRISKLPGGGKALLFENVEGSDMPVLINAFGSLKRICAALGVSDLEEIPRNMERYLKLVPPATLADKMKMLPLLLEAAHFPPKLVPSGKAPCQEVVLTGDDVNLSRLPILQCWPRDAGRFITFPIVINRSADRRLRNVGLYRMQVFDPRTTAMHWHIHKDGAHFFHEFRKKNKVMEVAVAIGADPAVCYAASAPLPYGIDEFLLAGFIRKSPVSLVPCKTVNLEVPATAEIVLEGFIDPSEMRVEGPFGDHTGYYSQDGKYPIFHLTAITHRKDPIYLTTIVGKPPQEDFYLGKATERIFLPLLRTQLPEIVDMNMPVEGVFHNLVVVSIDKRFPMQARRLMSALWGLGQMSFVKTIVVVDREIDVHNLEDVAYTLLNKTDLKRDLFFSEGVLDVLNHSSDHPLFGSKLGIDLTAKISGEPGYEEPRAASNANPEDFDPAAVLKIFPEAKACHILEMNTRLSICFVALEKTRPHQPKEFFQRFFDSPVSYGVSIAVVFEPHVDIRSLSQSMWKFFSNLDPRRDFHFTGERLGIDVSRKRPEEGHRQTWPDEIEMSDEIRKQVDEKWSRLFPNPL